MRRTSSIPAPSSIQTENIAQTAPKPAVFAQYLGHPKRSVQALVTSPIQGIKERYLSRPTSPIKLISLENPTRTRKLSQIVINEPNKPLLIPENQKNKRVVPSATLPKAEGVLGKTPQSLQKISVKGDIFRCAPKSLLGIPALFGRSLPGLVESPRKQIPVSSKTLEAVTTQPEPKLIQRARSPKMGSSSKISVLNRMIFPRYTKEAELTPSAQKPVFGSSMMQSRSSNISKPLYVSSLTKTVRNNQLMRSQLQQCLQNLRSSQSTLEKPSLEAKASSSEIHEFDSSEFQKAEARAESPVGKSGPSLALKELLQDSTHIGVEMTVQDYKRLEKSSSGYLRPNSRGCLKSPPSCHFTLDADKTGSASTELSSDWRIKRAVSFSENVVMFIYQA
jgi:hypothetical protein